MNLAAPKVQRLNDTHAPACWGEICLVVFGLVRFKANLQDAIAERVAVQRLDGHHRLLVVGHRDEAESLALVRLQIANHLIIVQIKRKHVPLATISSSRTHSLAFSLLLVLPLQTGRHRMVRTAAKERSPRSPARDCTRICTSRMR